ncbi:MAG: hypothetical protein AAFN77_00765 [Planctomycetota bacterium]
MIRKFCLPICLIGVVTLCLATEASAQNTFRRHRTLRWLGQGFSDGYHRCNPGYDSSHYNPYSSHNSFLYSQTPQFRQLPNTQNYAMSSQANLQFFGGVPFSVYAAPPKNSNMLNGRFPGVPGESIDSSFEATEKATKAGDENSFEFDTSDQDDSAGDEASDEMVNESPFIDDRNGRLDDRFSDQKDLEQAEARKSEEDKPKGVSNPTDTRSPATNNSNDFDDDSEDLENDDKAAFRLPILNGSGIDPIRIEPATPFRKVGFQKKQ